MSAVYPDDEPEERHRDEDERGIVDKIIDRIVQ